MGKESQNRRPGCHVVGSVQAFHPFSHRVGVGVDLSALFLYLSLRELCNRRQAIGFTLIYALGTNTWTVSSQALWQHGLSELSLSMVYALLKARQRELWLLVAGLGVALATANRPPNILFALFALAYVWRYHR
jgi:4-amino-4-deoxy-L-arabinose transferase-like glycosyltransferase